MSLGTDPELTLSLDGLLANQVVWNAARAIPQLSPGTLDFLAAYGKDFDMLKTGQEHDCGDWPGHVDHMRCLASVTATR